MTRRYLIVLAAVSVTAYGVYFAAAVRSPLFDSGERARFAYLTAAASRTGPAAEDLRAAAESYWNRNPDVAEDGFFGRQGPLGPHGAMAHYRRHGRHEGRIWQAPR